MCCNLMLKREDMWMEKKMAVKEVRERCVFILWHRARERMWLLWTEKKGRVKAESDDKVAWVKRGKMAVWWRGQRVGFPPPPPPSDNIGTSDRHCGLLTRDTGNAISGHFFYFAWSLSTLPL